MEETEILRFSMKLWIVIVYVISAFSIFFALSSCDRYECVESKHIESVYNCVDNDCGVSFTDGTYERMLLSNKQSNRTVCMKWKEIN